VSCSNQCLKYAFIAEREDNESLKITICLVMLHTGKELKSIQYLIL